MFRKILLALLSALLLTLAWPANGFPFLLFFAFLPLLKLEEESAKARQLFTLSFLSFFVWNLSTTYWIMHASFGGMLAAVLINALLMATAFTLFSRIKSQLGEKRGWWAFVCAWIAFEYLHLNWDLSWPWLTLGNGFANYPSLVQWYEYTGVLGGSFWVLVGNVLAYRFWRHRKVAVLAFWLTAPIIASLFLFEEEVAVDEIEVLVVQPNIDPYKEKFSGMSAEEQLSRFISLAESKLDSTVNYLIGPETALVDPLWENNIAHAPAIRQLSTLLAKYPRLKIIVGASTFRLMGTEEPITHTSRPLGRENRHYEAYNTAIQLDTTGIQLYHKSKLVPGVEFIPFGSAFKLLEHFSIDLGGVAGKLVKQDERAVFSSERSAAAPVICYESIYGDYMAEYMRAGANFIAVITNDGWWKDTPGYRQHLQYASLRAIEGRRAIARSANTGTSAFITAEGELHQATPWWEEAVIRQALPTYNRWTFYVIYGDYIGRLSTFVLAILLLYAIVARKKRF